MLYKLLNKVFGWDYVAWANTADAGIARVHLDGEGKPYYWQYKLTKVIRQIPNDRHDQVVWLTCSPDKYITTQQ